MVGKKVVIVNPFIQLLFGGIEGGTITSYKAESFDHPNFPPEFKEHDTGLTFVTDDGVHLWVKIEDVEIVED
jgi:hypothetical protein